MGSASKPTVSEAFLAAALRLRVDPVTAEVVSALSEAGVRSILLKGPSIAAWLYADGSPRPYIDTDLLVSPDALSDAEHVLRARGFRPGQPDWQGVSRSWRRANGAIVDLHTSLFAIEAAPETVWRELSTRTVPLRIGGRDVEALSRPALAFHVALHAAQHGMDGASQRDLERALTMADESCWQQAAALASRLAATPVFATGLRLRPEGVRLAERLSLSGQRSTLAALHAEGTKPLVLGLEHLATAADNRARLRFLGRKLAPSPRYLRSQSALARRNNLGLALAYFWRPLSMLLRLPAAFRAWRRARHDAGETRAAR